MLYSSGRLRLASCTPLSIHQPVNCGWMRRAYGRGSRVHTAVCTSTGRRTSGDRRLVTRRILSTHLSTAALLRKPPPPRVCMAAHVPHAYHSSIVSVVRKPIARPAPYPRHGGLGFAAAESHRLCAAQVDPSMIRNFSIIAHIDHGTVYPTLRMRPHRARLVFLLLPLCVTAGQRPSACATHVFMPSSHCHYVGSRTVAFLRHLPTLQWRSPSRPQQGVGSLATVRPRWSRNRPQVCVYVGWGAACR
jgi:hypothetical protein